VRSSRGCHGEDVIFHFNGGLFCACPSRSPGLFSPPPRSPSRSPVYLFLFPPPVGDPPPWPLYSRSHSGGLPLSSLSFPSPPSTFSVVLLIPAASSSVRSRSRLDSFLLSRRERLNSLRPLFAPTSASPFPLGIALPLARLLRGHRASKSSSWRCARSNRNSLSALSSDEDGRPSGEFRV